MPKIDESLKPSGTSVTAKIIFSVALVVAISCSIFIIVSVFLVGNTIEDEINKKGLSLAKLLSSIDLNIWKYVKEPNITNSILQKLIQEIDEGRANDTTARNHLRDEIIEKLRRSQIGRIDMENKYINPLEQFTKLEGSILFISIAKGNGCLNIGGTTEAIISYDIGLPKDKEGKIVVRGYNVYTDIEGNYQIGDTYLPFQGKEIPSRYFIYCIKDENKNPIGEVTLHIDTTYFEKAKIRVVRILLIPLLLALATSIIIGGIMATKIVSPIKELISDIEEISKGNLEHRATVKSSDEIGLIGVSFNRMTKSLKLYMEEVINRAVITQEYESATNLINEYLLKIKERPKISNLDVSIIYYPSKDVSGDYYDYDIIDKNKLYILVADVAGKGLPASLISTVFKNLILHELDKTKEPKEILINVNRTLGKSLKKGMFVTTSFLVYDIEKQIITAYSAGHLPVLIYRPSEGRIIEVNPPGIAIGLDRKLFEKNKKTE